MFNTILQINMCLHLFTYHVSVVTFVASINYSPVAANVWMNNNRSNSHRDPPLCDAPAPTPDHTELRGRNV